MPLLGLIGLLVALVGTWQQQCHKITHRPLNWVLALLAVWLAIASSFAYSPTDALLGLFNFLPFFGLFAVFSALIQTPAQLWRLANILVITSVVVVFLGFGQLFWGWASPKEWQDILGVLGCAIVPQGNPPGRMTSVFMYANILAGYLVIVFILSLGLLLETFQGGDRRQEKLGTRGEGNKETRGEGKNYQLPITNYQSKIQNPKSKIQNLYTRLFLFVAAVGNLVALILTNSRNAWAIAVFAVIAFAIYQGWRWLLVGVSAIASSIFLAAFGPAPLQQLLRLVVPSYFWQRLTDQQFPNRPVVSLRTTQWQFAWNLAQQRPWTGWGLRNFQPLYEARMHAWFGHPHNLFLMLAAEIGIPATLVFCGCVAWVLYQAIGLLLKWSASDRGEQHYPRERLIVFSYLIAFFACIFFNTVDVTIFDIRLNTLIWLLLSAICGVVYHQHATAKQK
jgi:O-antigen ligase